MTRFILSNGSVAALLALLAGCASTGPTSELVDARRAYDQARMSDAKDYAPDRLLSAKQALDAAERAHADDPGSYKERDLSYVASRKSELAQVYGDLLKDQKVAQQQQANYGATQDRLRRQAEQRAAASEKSLEATTGALTRTQGELSAEQIARQSAEQRANAAIQSLQKLASVKEEARGMVITLEGSVLFVTGKSELLPLAQEKLNDVAEALKQADGQKILVEGYTDARGGDDMNMKLSQARADSVRAYLVSRGVKPDMISAIGRGKQDPIASNDTPEGRANNRRVEIVVQPQGTQNNPNSGSSSSPTYTPTTVTSPNR